MVEILRLQRAACVKLKRRIDAQLGRSPKQDTP
jgi:hypothetical protein